MADTFERATADEKMSATMRDFCDYFAEKARVETRINKKGSLSEPFLFI